MAEYKITFPFALNQKESEVSMRRRFFNARIPRKLKKAAKYGIERRVYQDENEISPITLVLNYRERAKFVVVGKRTKWKLKARLACEKEERQRIARLWHRCNRMIVWGV